MNQYGKQGYKHPGQGQFNQCEHHNDHDKHHSDEHDKHQGHDHDHYGQEMELQGQGMRIQGQGMTMGFPQLSQQYNINQGMI